MKKIIFTAVLILLWFQTGFAHHLWIIREDGRLVVARGHMPDKPIAYSVESVREMTGFDKSGGRVALERKDEENRVVFGTDKEIFMATVRCDWGFRVNTTQGKKLMNRQDAQQAGFRVMEAFFSTQFLKSVFDSSEGITKPAGLKLEIVPMKNPFELGSDELLPVQVLFDGKPLSDTPVSSEGADQEIKTNQDGIAMVRFAKNETLMIYAKRKLPVQNNPEMEYHLFTSFLIIQGK